MLQKNETGAGEVAQWVRPLAAMPDNLSLLLQTHMEEGENQLPCWWWCVCGGATGEDKEIYYKAAALPYGGSSIISHQRGIFVPVVKCFVLNIKYPPQVHVLGLTTSWLTHFGRFWKC